MTDEKEREGHGSKWSPTRKEERKAVNVLNSIFIENSSIQADIETDDKYPDVDGVVHLVDGEGRTTSTLLVQVKKIHDEETDTPKLSGLKRENIEFALDRIQPCLLIGVDTDAEVGYWVHLDAEFIDKLDITPNQRYKTVRFPEENAIENGDKGYLEDWRDIVDYSRNIPELRELWEDSGAALADERREFEDIQAFLDTYNSLIERDFSLVKDTNYPDTWKVGFVNAEYSNERALYALYPLREGLNDVLIKDVNVSDLRELANERDDITLAREIRPNTISETPKKYAFNLVKDTVEELAENQRLDHSENQFLAVEYLFSFIDRFHNMMGLDKKNSYSIEEVTTGYSYLQIFVAEFRNRKPRQIGTRNKPYTDIGLIRSDRSVNRDDVHQVVENRLRDGDTIDYGYHLGAQKYPPGLFEQAIDALEGAEVDEIERPYQLPDRPPLEEGEQRNVWDGFSPETVRNNLEVMFTNLPTEYETLVTANFTEIEDRFELFFNASKIVVLHEIGDDWEPNRLSLEIHYLKNITDDGVSIGIFHKDDSKAQDLELDKDEQFVSFDGRIYEKRGVSVGSHDYLYHDHPLLTYIYDILEGDLRQVLEKYETAKLY